MKRFHVHVAVPDLEDGIRFYSTLFGAEPSVRKDDYAKWMLEDPRVNFAISQRGGAAGVNHLGFQVDEPAELEEIHARLQTADSKVSAEKNVSCCYARSDKYWVTDPAGVAWESFRSLGTVPFYHGEGEESSKDSCCAPAAEAKEAQKAACCAPASVSGTAARASCC
ncbi:MAG TPA: ArsI/CadI family heavy metal resistance metalloenzyme [Usitatibacter sp.]|nr:ArsI/CadI family heavy metal resistance metalloenzyme [Usitatibacter sp.]